MGNKMKLGRLPHDPVALAAAPAHRFGDDTPPPVLDRSGVAFAPGEYGNRIFPDCTAAGLANYARAVTALNGYALAVDPDKPLAFYGECVGNPDDLESTHGAVLLDVLNRQASVGFDIGPQRLVGLYGTVQRERASLALSIARFGAGYWGITLHEQDMVTFGGDGPWDLTDNDGPAVGGHCVVAFDYSGLGDTDTVRIATWGVWKPATWRWIEARLDEAHALVYRQLVRADGTFYAGLSPDGLATALGET